MSDFSGNQKSKSAQAFEATRQGPQESCKMREATRLLRVVLERRRDTADWLRDATSTGQIQVLQVQSLFRVLQDSQGSPVDSCLLKFFCSERFSIENSHNHCSISSAGEAQEGGKPHEIFESKRCQAKLNSAASR